MLKYCLKVFDTDNNLIMQFIVPCDDLLKVINDIKEFGTVKGFILDDESEVK